MNECRSNQFGENLPKTDICVMRGRNLPMLKGKMIYKKKNLGGKVHIYK